MILGRLRQELTYSERCARQTELLSKAQTLYPYYRNLELVAIEHTVAMAVSQLLKGILRRRIPSTLPFSLFALDAGNYGFEEWMDFGGVF